MFSKMHRSTGHGIASRRGQGHQHQSGSEDRIASSAAAMVLLIGVLAQVLREPGDLSLHQRRADGLADGHLAAPPANPHIAPPAPLKRHPAKSVVDVYYEDEGVYGVNSMYASPRKANTRSGDAVQAPLQARVLEPPHRPPPSFLVQGRHRRVSAHSSKPMVDDAEEPQRKLTYALPRSRSEPSRVLLRSHYQSRLDEERETPPTPPRSPLNGESLQEYLMMSYNKWMSHHGYGRTSDASVLESPLWRGGSSKVEHTSAGHVEDGRSPAVQMLQQLGQAPTGHTPEEILQFVGDGFQSIPPQNNPERYLKRLSVSSDDSGRATPTPFDEFSYQGDGVRGEDTNKHLLSTAAGRRRPRRVRWSNSAPSPYMCSRATSTHDDVFFHDNQYYPQRLQRAASVIWSSDESPDASYESAQPTQNPRAPTSQANCTRTGGSGRSSFGPQGSFRPPSSLSQQEAWHGDRGRVRKSTDEHVSATSTSLHQGAVQPVQMTIQFCNHPSSGPSSERATLCVPSGTGNTRGRVKEKKILRSKSTSERAPLPSENLANLPASAFQTASHASHGFAATVTMPIQEQGADGTLTGARQAQHAAKGTHSAVKPPRRHSSSPQHAEKCYRTRSAPPAKQGGASGSAPQWDSHLDSGTDRDQPSSLTSNVATSSSTQKGTRFKSRLPVPIHKSSSLVRPTSMSSSLSAPHTLRSDVDMSVPPGTSASWRASEDRANEPLKRLTFSHLTTTATQTSGKTASFDNTFFSRAPAAEEESLRYASTRTSPPELRHRHTLAPSHPLHRDGNAGESTGARSTHRTSRAGLPLSEALMSTTGALQRVVIKGGDSSGPLSSREATAHMIPAFHHDGGAHHTGTRFLVPAGQPDMYSYYSIPDERPRSALRPTAEDADYHTATTLEFLAAQPVEDEFRE